MLAYSCDNVSRMLVAGGLYFSRMYATTLYRLPLVSLFTDRGWCSSGPSLACCVGSFSRVAARLRLPSLGRGTACLILLLLLLLLLAAAPPAGAAVTHLLLLLLLLRLLPLPLLLLLLMVVVVLLPLPLLLLLLAPHLPVSNILRESWISTSVSKASFVVPALTPLCPTLAVLIFLNRSNHACQSDIGGRISAPPIISLSSCNVLTNSELISL